MTLAGVLGCAGEPDGSTGAADVGGTGGGWGPEALMDAPREPFVLPPRPPASRCQIDPDALTATVSDPVAPANGWPELLSDLDCTDATGILGPEFGVVPFTVAAPLWTDGAIKTRFLVLPDGEVADVTSAGEWGFPVGTVLLKHFALPAPGDEAPAPIETRVMVRTTDGWAFRGYRWDAEASEAHRVDQSLEVPAGGEGSLPRFDYGFPSPYACAVCHGFDGGHALGLRNEQLNIVVPGFSADVTQVQAFAEAGYVALPEDEVLASPYPGYRSGAPVAERARAYLDTHCASCHRPGGWVPSELDLDLRFGIPLEQSRTCGVDLQFSSTVPGVLRITPGDREASNLWQRMRHRGDGQMPMLGTALPDAAGLELVGDWIDTLHCD